MMRERKQAVLERRKAAAEKTKTSRNGSGGTHGNHRGVVRVEIEPPVQQLQTQQVVREKEAETVAATAAEAAAVAAAGRKRHSRRRRRPRRRRPLERRRPLAAAVEGGTRRAMTKRAGATSRAHRARREGPRAMVISQRVYQLGGFVRRLRFAYGLADRCGAV